MTTGYIHFDSFDIVDKKWFDKNHFLTFDKIYYHIFAEQGYRDFAKAIGIEYVENFDQKLKQLEYLEKLGLYENISSSKRLQESVTLSESEQLLFDKFIHTSNIVFHEIKDYLTKTKDKNWIERYNKLDRIGQELLSQGNSILIEKHMKKTCVPIIRFSNRFTQKFFPELKKDYLSLTFNSLPSISNETSWEKIVEFKSDPDTQKKFLALKNWINDLTYSNLSEIHFIEKLEHSLNEYQEHMRIHKMKQGTNNFEIFLTTTAEILENAVKLNFSKSIKTFFEIGKQEMALMEAENSAPFREVAYLDKANNHFKNSL